MSSPVHRMLSAWFHHIIVYLSEHFQCQIYWLEIGWMRCCKGTDWSKEAMTALRAEQYLRQWFRTLTFSLLQSPQSYDALGKSFYKPGMILSDHYIFKWTFSVSKILDFKLDEQERIDWSKEAMKDLSSCELSSVWDRFRTLTFSLS
jgi:hypothetical protein